MNDNHYQSENEKGSNNENAYHYAGKNDYHYAGKNDYDYHIDSKNVSENHFQFLGKCGKGYGGGWQWCGIVSWQS